MENVMLVIGLVTMLAVAYQKLTESIAKKITGKIGRILNPIMLCFILSFLTCLFWNLGLLNLYKPAPIVFDAIVTALIMTFEAGIINDFAGMVQGKKEQLQK
jgi:hypothetical protein